MEELSHGGSCEVTNGISPGTRHTRWWHRSQAGPAMPGAPRPSPGSDQEREAGNKTVGVQLFGLRPANLSQRADAHRNFADGDLAAYQGRAGEGAGGDDTKAALTHVVDVTGYRSAPSSASTERRKFGNADLEVLREPWLRASIVFVICFHAAPSWRGACVAYIAQMA